MLINTHHLTYKLQLHCCFISEKLDTYQCRTQLLSTRSHDSSNSGHNLTTDLYDQLGKWDIIQGCIHHSEGVG